MDTAGKHAEPKLPSAGVKRASPETKRKACSNCGVTATPAWRREKEQLVCNACSLRFKRAANRRRKHAGRQRASSPPAAIDQTPSPGKPAGGLTESHIDVSPTPLPIAEIAEEELARTDSMTRSDSSGQITQTENTHPAAECNLSPGMAGLVNLQPACSRQQQLLGRIEFHLSLEKARLLGPQAFMTWEEEWFRSLQLLTECTNSLLEMARDMHHPVMLFGGAEEEQHLADPAYLKRQWSSTRDSTMPDGCRDWSAMDTHHPHPIGFDAELMHPFHGF